MKDYLHNVIAKPLMQEATHREEKTCHHLPHDSAVLHGRSSALWKDDVADKR
jgi:hypothetical protein